MRGRALRLVAVAVALFAFATNASAAPQPATVTVTIQNFVFMPTAITIDKGDIIRWTNLDSAPHSAVSIQPGFVTATLAQGQTTTTTFDRPGTYEYLCGVHGQSMKGTVVVRGTPVAETAAPAGPGGHVTVDSFTEARPDELGGVATNGALYLGIAAVLALAAIARFAWVLRHP